MDLLQDRLHIEWIVNTFIVYNINAVANQRKKVTYKKYWPELIQDLVGKHTSDTSKDGKEKKAVDIWQWIIILRSDQRCDINECAIYSSWKEKGDVRAALFFLQYLQKMHGDGIIPNFPWSVGGHSKHCKQFCFEKHGPI